MKKIFLSTLFSILATAQILAAILLSFQGESNLCGRANTVNSTVVANFAGTWWYKHSNNTLQQFNEASYPTGESGHQSTSYSMAPMFAKRLKELTGEDVIIIPSAWGATQISAWQKGEGLYNEALDAWGDAIAYCAANSITISAKYVYWHQGGNDVGREATDGYYVQLQQYVSDVVADFTVPVVFSSRFGYDPNYASAATSNAIHRAHEIANINIPQFVQVSKIATTFTSANGREEGDQVHYTLLGLNEIAEESVQEIVYWRNNSFAKPTISENVSALVGTTGAIDLTKKWLYTFNSTFAENGSHNTNSFYNRNTFTSNPSYESGALVFDWHEGMKFSRPFSSTVFFIETRLKLNGSTGEHTILSNFGGGFSNLFLMEAVATTWAGTVYFHGLSWSLTQDYSQYHTYKFVGNGSTVTFYVDNVQQGSPQAYSTTPKFQYIGIHNSATKDAEMTMDYLKMTDNATGEIPEAETIIISKKGRRAIIQ